jgi:hypothetical protein
MELRLSWHKAFTANPDVRPTSFHVVRPGQHAKLRAELVELTPGEVRLSLRVKRTWFGRWKTLEVPPDVSAIGPDQLTCDVMLLADDLGVSDRSFAQRTIELGAELVSADERVIESATAKVHAMPARQFALTHWVRWLAFLPLWPLFWAVQSGQMSADVATWYGALSLGAAVVVQEQPLTRFSSTLRAATRGVVPALLTMAALLLVEWSLLVRVDNQTNDRLVLSGLQLERGQTELTWRWRAPTLRALTNDTTAWNSFAIESAGLVDTAGAWSFWQSVTVCCKTFRLSCERADHAPDCEAASTHCQRTGQSKRAASPLASADAVEPGPGCTVPAHVRRSLKIAVVLGRDAGTPAELATDPTLDAQPACDGNYEVSLEERDAYGGSRLSRAQHAASFAMLRLSGVLDGTELRWQSAAAVSSGFVSVTATSPTTSGAKCLVMIPVRNGVFEVELRGSALGELRGTLRCPSVGACKSNYTIVPAYAVEPAGFDGLASYEVEHGRSVWSQLGSANQGYVCRCEDDASERQRGPKQATIRLSRPPPPRLQLTFDRNEFPQHIDITAGEQRSVLECLYIATPTARVDIQPVQISFQPNRQRVEVSGSETNWMSTWTWLEGDHQAWSCTPANTTGRLALRVDDGEAYAYEQNSSGDSPALPTCYLHPRSGAITTDAPAQAASCRWREATDEYAALVQTKHVCLKVLSCR